MGLIKIMSIVFKVAAYIIGMLALFFLLEEDTGIVAITLLFLMYFALFISERLEVHEISSNVDWSPYQRRGI